MGTLAGLTRLKRRAADARRNLTLQVPPSLAAGSPEREDAGGRDLALDMCRSSSAVLQIWHDKIFPGEGADLESARKKTFSGGW